ncbi:MAG: HAMP domain-containing sensor histidine kinase [Gammaproteobacteria bacterium]|nr:HAMP domain-containing sensor histidine kinase [Gammaproteobacteria bacterium]
MHLPNLFRTTAFRVALLYAGLFGFSGFAALGFIYWTTTSYLEEQTDTVIRSEMNALRETYQIHGLNSLQRTVAERAAAGGEDTDHIYLLANPGYTLLAGNLPAWPEDLRRGAGWARLTLTERDKEARDEHDVREARALSVTLPGGAHLLVGRDLREREELREHTLSTLFWALGVILALALAGGLILSRGVLRRIERINHTSRAIMAGHLEQRMPLSGSGDEFDQLAQNLNLMLDQIERLMNGLREVTDNIAHDLRSPLTRLKSRLESGLRETFDGARYRATLEQTLSEVDGVLATFNALLRIAQAEAGAHRSDWVPLDLGELARDVAELYQPAIEEQGDTLTTHIGEGLVLHGSRELVAQALANLLDNAIKYTPRGSRIELGATRADGAIELSVSDNGPGIPAAARERVLERFVRLDASRHQPGSGLGLSLVRAVANLHHAALELSDHHPGLKVTLRFPLLRSHQAKHVTLNR